MKRILALLTAAWLLIFSSQAFATVTAYYPGNGTNNADPGQLTDGSGNSNTLTLSGTVGNPSSPTPPEGANWMLGLPSSGAFINAPGAAFNTSQGMIEFQWRCSGNPAFGTTLLVMGSSGGYIVFWSQNNNTLTVHSSAGPNVDFITSPNTTYKVRFEYQAGGTSTLYVDGVSQGTLTCPTMSGISHIEIGGDDQISGQSLTNGYIDALQFGDSMSDVYIPDAPPASATSTITPSYTRTPTKTVTPSITSTWSNTSTATKTATPTPSITPTWTNTSTATPSCTITPSITQTWTSTDTSTVTPTFTPTITPSITVTFSVTKTVTRTATFTPTITASPTVSRTKSPSPSPSITKTVTVTKTASRTLTSTKTYSPSPTFTRTKTVSPTPTMSRTLTATKTWSPSATKTDTATRTITRTFTNTRTVTPTVTRTWTPHP